MIKQGREAGSLPLFVALACVTYRLFAFAASCALSGVGPVAGWDLAASVYPQVIGVALAVVVSHLLVRRWAGWGKMPKAVLTVGLFVVACSPWQPVAISRAQPVAWDEAPEDVLKTLGIPQQGQLKGPPRATVVFRAVDEKPGAGAERVEVLETGEKIALRGPALLTHEDIKEVWLRMNTPDGPSVMLVFREKAMPRLVKLASDPTRRIAVVCDRMAICARSMPAVIVKYMSVLHKPKPEAALDAFRRLTKAGPNSSR